MYWKLLMIHWKIFLDHRVNHQQQKINEHLSEEVSGKSWPKMMLLKNVKLLMRRKNLRNRNLFANNQWIPIERKQQEIVRETCEKNIISEKYTKTTEHWHQNFFVNNIHTFINIIYCTLDTSNSSSKHNASSTQSNILLGLGQSFDATNTSAHDLSQSKYTIYVP